MVRTGFDNEQYLSMQSQHILERIKQFGGKLYLEFGGKLFDDYHASRDVLLDKVWGYGYMGETNVVDVYIRYLRSKIDDVFGVKLIHTVRGVGYVVKEDHGQ